MAGGGGLGSVLGTAGSIATGGSPIGAFGSTLGSQLLQGGGGGGGGRGGSGVGMPGGAPGIGTQNQTQITGPYAGMNPASPAYNFMRQQEMQRAQQQQMQPQVQQPAMSPSAAVFNQLTPLQQQNAIKYGDAHYGEPRRMATPQEMAELGISSPNPSQVQQIQQAMEKARLSGVQPMGGGVFSQGQPFQGPSFGFARPYMQDLMKQQQMRDMSPRPMPQGLAGLMGQLQGGPQTFRGFM